MLEANKEIPFNVSDFRFIRENNYLYVDKTMHVETLLNSQNRFFLLLRPQGFGKTIFLKTLECFFRGEERLFRGLYIHDKVKSFEKFPVIKLNMEIPALTAGMLSESVMSRLKAAAEEEGLDVRYQDNPPESLYWLIRDLKTKYNKRVVILVDSYDKPILDHLYNPTVGASVRGVIREFYQVLKDAEPNLQFVYLTGRVKMCQSVLHSTLDNLTDLTFLDEFATAFGYTREEFFSNFSERFETLLEKMIREGRRPGDYSIVDLRNEILDYYDGHSWNGVEKVFSPCQINRYFYLGGPKGLGHKGDSPLLLQNMLKEDMDQFIRSTFQNCLSNEFYKIDVGKVNNTALMFYEGYLTVDNVFSMNGKWFYNLKIQNHEVNNEFCNTLYLNFFAHKPKHEMNSSMQQIIFASCTKNDRALEALLSELIFTIPIVDRLKDKCLKNSTDITTDDVDVFAPAPSFYDYFAPDLIKNELFYPQKDIPSEIYLKNVYAWRINNHFNVIFQTALQSFFEWHGFLTKPEVLRGNRECAIECVSRNLILLIKVVNVKPRPRGVNTIEKILASAAKTALDHLNHLPREDGSSSSSVLVRRIGIAISPFELIKVAFND
ncbi:MAG: AAA family ATPase [Deltaproteobacteria bacterium]|nr:AAA family ATPase [Deltaproteobacteria bacterium]